MYFVSIHPFEDGNGRLARALSVKAISQGIKHPLLTSLSTIIQNDKKKYYAALENNNKNNEITDWLLYFSETILAAQNHTQKLIELILQKTKLYQEKGDELNDRQKKVIERLFREGPKGFKGGISAENYLALTKASRATSTRDLQDLVNKKILKKVGELKSTRYFLNVKY